MRRLNPCTLSILVFATLCVPSAAQQTAAPSWEKLRSAYEYKPSEAGGVKEEPREDAEFRLSRLTFTNGKGQTVGGLFLRPKADGPYPCVLLLHGLTSDKETMIRLFGRVLAARGIASLALDADQHGDRKPQEANARPAPGQFPNIVRGGIVDYRMALDYLRTRKDVDSARVGLVGYSMGAMMGSILAGVDERVKASVLMVGGDLTPLFAAQAPAEVREQLAYASPANFVGHISPRSVFFINGKTDSIVPEAAAKRLHDAAKEPKQILWADAGHILPAEVAVKGVDWLVERLAAKL